MLRCPPFVVRRRHQSMVPRGRAHTGDQHTAQAEDVRSLHPSGRKFSLTLKWSIPCPACFVGTAVCCPGGRQTPVRGDGPPAAFGDKYFFRACRQVNNCIYCNAPLSVEYCPSTRGARRDPRPKMRYETTRKKSCAVRPFPDIFSLFFCLSTPRTLPPTYCITHARKKITHTSTHKHAQVGK